MDKAQKELIKSYWHSRGIAFRMGYEYSPQDYEHNYIVSNIHDKENFDFDLVNKLFSFGKPVDEKTFNKLLEYDDEVIQKYFQGRYNSKQFDLEYTFYEIKYWLETNNVTLNPKGIKKDMLLMGIARANKLSDAVNNFNWDTHEMQYPLNVFFTEYYRSVAKTDLGKRFLFSKVRPHNWTTINMKRNGMFNDPVIIDEIKKHDPDTFRIELIIYFSENNDELFNYFKPRIEELTLRELQDLYPRLDRSPKMKEALRPYFEKALKDAGLIKTSKKVKDDLKKYG